MYGCKTIAVRIFHGDNVANTYSQIYLHFVFAEKHRRALIPRQHKDELHRFMASLIEARKCKPLAIHCMPDHAHVFVGFHPTVSIPDFVKEIKVQSTTFLRSKGWVPQTFQWQEGYGVFSYGHSQIARVCNYVHNQEEHHRRKTFQEEYKLLLEKFNVAYDLRYIFDQIGNPANLSTSTTRNNKSAS